MEANSYDTDYSRTLLKIVEYFNVILYDTQRVILINLEVMAFIV